MTGKKILFVEDDLNPKKKVDGVIKEILNEFKGILRKYGEVIEAYSYSGALQKLDIDTFSLAVVDIVLPEEDGNFSDEESWGKELILRIKQKNIPVIGISNKTDFTTVSELRDPPYEVVAVIHKKTDPRHKRKFEEYVKSALQPKKRSRYCSYNDGVCEKEFLFQGNQSIFAISSKDKINVIETIYNSCKEKYSIKPWTHRSPGAGLIFCDHVCREIYGNNIILAEISDMNPNVFFEIGFALGLGRKVILLKRKGEDIDLEILQHVFYEEYENINDIKKILDSTSFLTYKIYSTPELFSSIPNFESPQARKKSGFFIVSWTDSTLQANGGVKNMKISTVTPNLIMVIGQLINANGIVFEIYGVDKKIINRSHNAPLLFIAGICVSQGVHVKIFIQGKGSPPADIKPLVLGSENEVNKFFEGCPL